MLSQILGYLACGPSGALEVKHIKAVTLCFYISSPINLLFAALSHPVTVS